MKDFTEPNDLLPVWGPYSKKYMGISRIVGGTSAIGDARGETVTGARFDCVVHPAEANANQPAPNVTFPSSWHMWEAAPDLSYFAYRVELEWKDRLYADVSFSRVSEEKYLIRTEYVNDTDLDRNCVLNYYFAIEYPRKCVVAALSDGEFSAKKFTEYDAIEYKIPRPWEHLMPDGLHRGEFFDASFTDGRGFGERAHMPEYVERTRFGEIAGDFVTLTLNATRGGDTLTLRYRTTSVSDAKFELTLLTSDGESAKREERKMTLTLPASETLTLFALPVSISAGDLTLTLTSHGEGGVELDFAAVSCAPVFVRERTPEFVPEVRTDGGSYMFSYDGVGEAFVFSPLTESVRVRDIPSGALEDALPSRLSQADPSFDRVLRSFTRSFSDKHSDDGFYKNFIVHSIFIPAHTHHVEYAYIGADKSEARETSASHATDDFTPARAEEIYVGARRAIRPPRYNGDGKIYEQSCRILQTALLTNVVYPIYRHGEWIKHHTPGKRWDSLYTWDSGFIGLGLIGTEMRLSKYILELYLSDPENTDFAFLLHGSPVPVQAYLWQELLNKSHGAERAEILGLYPRLRRYYRYLSGKDEGSVTDMFESGLLNTFSYFYNCSGMDDLPPQVRMHAEGRENECAPALTTSQVIRMAKILRIAADELGLGDDVREYESDVARLADALLKYAWDPESGYFGYVVHGADGRPIGVYRTPDGENLSKGMDGVYPLVAGICTPEQEKRLLSHIFSENEMFSRVGVSAVDMSASYYAPDGYWNGNVWFSHQWFLWKTMLDLGVGEGAFGIAKRALDAWKTEVDHSYFTFEMLNIATGRGGWYHHFGGLSSPVLIWGEAYYRPGNLSCGFDMTTENVSFNADANALSATVTNHGGRPGLIVAVIAPTTNVSATVDGEEVDFVRRTDGAFEVAIPVGVKKTKFRIAGK